MTIVIYVIDRAEIIQPYTSPWKYSNINFSSKVKNAL